MYLSNISVAKESKRSRRPLKRLPRSYANRMSFPSDGPSPFYPVLSINDAAMETPSPSYSTRSLVQPNERQTSPPIDFTASSVNILEQTYQAGEKRMKTDQGYSVSPGIDAAGDDEAVALHGWSMTSGEKARVDSSRKDGNPESLALIEDKRHLTELHCFVRRNNVYLFCADAKEVGGKYACLWSLFHRLIP